MSADVTARTRALLEEAAALHTDDPAVAGAVADLRTRLDEPVRVALAGRVKAGKSTLLNAIVGERLAPTDTGECTRVVTWYRYGEVPAVEVRLRDGRVVPRPVRRVEGRLLLDTAGHDLEDVARIVVTWPSPPLRTMTVIDTPGLASLTTEVSARATEALTPAEGGPEVDAVVYLMRHLHASDAELMEAFRDVTVGGATPVGTVALLARADEVGGGRIDAMVSATQVAARYSADERVRRMALAVLPVAGLLAEGARTLRQVDFDALREIALLSAGEREDLFVSADRFATAPMPQLTVATAALRSDLLARLGFFGVRIGTALLRGPVPDATALAHELTRRSGLGAVAAALTTSVAERSTLLKTRSALAGLERLLSTSGRPDSRELADRATALRTQDHGLVEADWLTRLRRGEVPDLAPEARDSAEQLLGAGGDHVPARLSLPEGSSSEEQRAAATLALQEWHRRQVDPLSAPQTLALGRAVVRTLDGILAGLGAP